MLCKCSAVLAKAPQTDDEWVMEPLKATPLGLSISQAAHELGVSLGTIRRWSDMGYLESYRTPGGQRRYSRDHIERFIGSLEQGARPGAVRQASMH
jgi:excisionase family DNA binding protein